jgi:hypothetical protein
VLGWGSAAAAGEKERKELPTNYIILLSKAKRWR